MTTLDTGWQLGMMPDFDPIEMKQRIQAEILRETEGMTGAEILEFFHKGSEEFQEEMRLRRAAKAQT